MVITEMKRVTYANGIRRFELNSSGDQPTQPEDFWNGCEVNFCIAIYEYQL